MQAITNVTGRQRVWFWVTVIGIVVSLAASSCNGGLSFGSRESIIGPRKAVDPLAAAETYLRQYQPGPLPRVFQTTRMYDRTGVLIAETFGEGRRVWIPLDRISQHLIDATIAVEDATFYTNAGIDPRRIAGAAIQNLQEGQIVSGASTITMQLARNLFLGPEQRYDQSVDRKLLEAGLAQELNTLYTKAELLEMYLNLLNYGQLAYGPEAAAQVYFGKSAADLTLAESAMLAGLPQQPAKLNPYDDLEAARRRQRTVLDLMVRHGYLDVAEADTVFAEPITLAGDKGLAPNLAPHFVQYVIEHLNAVYGDEFTQRAGFQVTTTLDFTMQQAAQAIVKEQVAALQPQFDLTNAALVALKPSTAEVLVMVGSADFADDSISGQVNVALSARQPGSAIKPVLYAAAIEDNLISPASVIWDVPVTYTIGLAGVTNGGDLLAASDLVYQPRNYDDKFHGPVTVRTALANSYNVPTIKLLDSLGVPRMLEMAHALGIRTLDKPGGWYGLSLTLGGGEVTLLDLTTAYTTLANGGTYLPPRAVVELRDSQGRVVENPIPTEPQSVLGSDTAFLITDILSDNVAREPAFGSSSPLVVSRPAAVKTGTTTDYRDNWTVGYTRYLVAGVWAGNSDGHPMRNASGVTGAAPIWHAFMEAVLAQPELLATLDAPSAPEAWIFPPPSGVERLPECPPGVTCRQGDEFFRRAWLEAAGENGLLADSSVRVASAPVYVQQGDQARLAGFCEMTGAAERTLLRMPAGFGLPERVAALSTVTPEVTPLADATPSVELLHALAWSLRFGAQVDLGPCEQLKTTVPLALALDADDPNMRVLVDVVGAAQSEPTAFDPATGLEIADIRGGEDLATLPGSYVLEPPIVHDAACPGQYIIGQVLDRSGAPVAGVRLMLRDPWGNRAETASKGGQGDYGQFDFPLWADGAYDMYLTVVDGGGNPLSSEIVVPHRQDAASNAPCHHLVLRGG